MGTKTIGVREEVYERLRARKRPDESFTDLFDRLLDETTVEWRDGFGTLQADADELEQLADRSRNRTNTALSDRQREAATELTEGQSDDETA
ncbi:antitoxin VapB family protein [Halalkalirubrum salinum]|uniref:antitoxin VapB family protein n=1 Tax=Halalkalirubrum salinum TaxID=2563889 RepID=UPI0010FBAFEE|nr:antitoxin VapB family protein [Halalkalirubrum salinum]